jgi:hypothetical protein
VTASPQHLSVTPPRSSLPPPSSPQNVPSLGGAQQLSGQKVQAGDASQELGSLLQPHGVARQEAGQNLPLASSNGRNTGLLQSSPSSSSQVTPRAHSSLPPVVTSTAGTTGAPGGASDTGPGSMQRDQTRSPTISDRGGSGGQGGSGRDGSGRSFDSLKPGSGDAAGGEDSAAASTGIAAVRPAQSRAQAAQVPRMLLARPPRTSAENAGNSPRLQQGASPRFASLQGFNTRPEAVAQQAGSPKQQQQQQQQQQQTARIVAQQDAVAATVLHQTDEKHTSSVIAQQPGGEQQQELPQQPSSTRSRQVPQASLTTPGSPVSLDGPVVSHAPVDPDQPGHIQAVSDVIEIAPLGYFLLRGLDHPRLLHSALPFCLRERAAHWQAQGVPPEAVVAGTHAPPGTEAGAAAPNAVAAAFGAPSHQSSRQQQRVQSASAVMSFTGWRHLFSRALFGGQGPQLPEGRQSHSVTSASRMHSLACLGWRDVEDAGPRTLSGATAAGDAAAGRAARQLGRMSSLSIGRGLSFKQLGATSRSIHAGACQGPTAGVGGVSGNNGSGTSRQSSGALARLLGMGAGAAAVSSGDAQQGGPAPGVQHVAAAGQQLDTLHISSAHSEGTSFSAPLPLPPVAQQQLQDSSRSTQQGTAANRGPLFSGSRSRAGPSAGSSTAHGISRLSRAGPAVVVQLHPDDTPDHTQQQPPGSHAAGAGVQQPQAPLFAPSLPLSSVAGTSRRTTINTISKASSGASGQVHSSGGGAASIAVGSTSHLVVASSNERKGVSSNGSRNSFISALLSLVTGSRQGSLARQQRSGLSRPRHAATDQAMASDHADHDAHDMETGVMQSPVLTAQLSVATSGAGLPPAAMASSAWGSAINVARDSSRLFLPAAAGENPSVTDCTDLPTSSAGVFTPALLQHRAFAAAAAASSSSPGALQDPVYAPGGGEGDGGRVGYASADSAPGMPSGFPHLRSSEPGVHISLAAGYLGPTGSIRGTAALLPPTGVVGIDEAARNERSSSTAAGATIVQGGSSQMPPAAAIRGAGQPLKVIRSRSISTSGTAKPAAAAGGNRHSHSSNFHRNGGRGTHSRVQSTSGSPFAAGWSYGGHQFPADRAPPATGYTSSGRHGHTTGVSASTTVVSAAGATVGAGSGASSPVSSSKASPTESHRPAMPASWGHTFPAPGHTSLPHIIEVGSGGVTPQANHASSPSRAVGYSNETSPAPMLPPPTPGADLAGSEADAATGAAAVADDRVSAPTAPVQTRLGNLVGQTSLPGVDASTTPSAPAEALRGSQVPAVFTAAASRRHLNKPQLSVVPPSPTADSTGMCHQ